jgi:hypothetical protein
MANCNLQSLMGIPYECDASLGGIKEIAVADYSVIFPNGASVNDVLDFDEDKIVTTIDNTANKPFKAFQFRKNTGNMETTASVSDATGLPLFTTNVTTVFGRMDAQKRLALQALALGQLCVLVKDANNRIWIIGTDDYASMTASTAATGTAKADANSYSLTLTAESVEYPYEVSPAIWETVVEYNDSTQPNE